jgi:hypothetical protein
MKSDRGRSLLLFSGSNDRAVLALLRVARECGVKFQIIANGPHDRILRGDYRDDVCAIRTNSELTSDLLESWINAARERTPRDELVIPPTSEFLNFFLLSLDAAHFQKQFSVSIPIVDSCLYEKLTNKETSTRLFRDAGIRVPNPIDIGEPTVLPFVAKPRRNVAGTRVLYPKFIRTRADLQTLINDGCSDEYFGQEYIVGASYYLLAYISASGDAFCSAQQNLAQQPGGKSILLARTCDFLDADASKKTIGLLRQQAYQGFAMIEFIVDDRGPCFIELNPRPWGPLQLCVDHNSGIVEAFLGEVVHGDPRWFVDNWSRKPSSAAYLWLGGFFQRQDVEGEIEWAIRGRLRRWYRVAKSLTYDVYLRRDSWRVFLHEVFGK